MTFSEPIERALVWLGKVAEEGGGIRRNLDLESGEFGTISLEITGYLIHLYSWLYRMTAEDRFLEAAVQHAEWIAGLQEHPSGLLSFEPGACRAYFFDYGIAARGMMALARVQIDRAAKRTAAFAERMAADMKRFEVSTGRYVAIVERFGDEIFVDNRWSSISGPWQFKAGLAWLATGDGDRLERMMLATQIPGGFAGLRLDPDEATNHRHPHAYYCEALWSVNAFELLAGELPFLLELMGQDHRVRCDALCQVTRLQLLRGDLDLVQDPNRKPFILEYQHEMGGFYFERSRVPASDQDRGYRWQPGPHLSVHATIFAIQALAMLDGWNTTAERRELRIV